MKAPVSIAKKVLEARSSEPEENPEGPPRKQSFPLVRTDPVDSLNQPCWIVVAQEAHFKPDGMLVVDKHVGG